MLSLFAGTWFHLAIGSFQRYIIATGLGQGWDQVLSEKKDQSLIKKILPVIGNRLDDIVGEGAWGKAASLLLTLRQNFNAERIADELLVLTDDEISALPSAYRHDNGYVKIPLLRSENSGATIRLNIWDPILPNMENIHYHRWDYSSWVVAGRLIESLFCENFEGDFYDEYEYSSRSEQDHYFISKKETRRISLYNTDTINTGTIYNRQYSQLHRSYPSEGRAAVTIQVTHSPRQAWSGVFRKASEALAETYPAPALTPREVRRQFEILSTGLQ